MSVRTCVGTPSSLDRYAMDMAKGADDFSEEPRVVLLNPDEDTSPEAFRQLVDELLSGPEPSLVFLGAAEVLEGLRAERESS